jgi:enoyl-CoA hydratase/carnithine racemase
MSLISVERSGAVATVWLDRADKRNALDAAMMRALAGALDELRDDGAARVLVLRGRGAAFSSGIDHMLLAELFQRSRSAPFPHLLGELQEVFHRLERMHRPVIAVLHRACMGMALELAMACDFRLATADCVLGLPEVAFGIIPDVGGTTRMVRLIGEARAKELIMTGKAISAATAERYGLVHEVAADAADLDRRVDRLVARLVAHSPVAVGHAKQLVAASAETDRASSFRLEGIFQEVMLGQSDLAQRLPEALAFIKREMAEPE